MFTNYISEVLTGNILDNCKIIPLTGYATRFHEIEFKGWDQKITLSDDDDLFNEIIEIAHKTFAVFVNIYKEKYAFCEPQFIFKPQGNIFSIKIGMMEIEIFDRLYGDLQEDNYDIIYNKVFIIGLLCLAPAPSNDPK